MPIVLRIVEGLTFPIAVEFACIPMKHLESATVLSSPNLHTKKNPPQGFVDLKNCTVGCLHPPDVPAVPDDPFTSRLIDVKRFVVVTDLDPAVPMIVGAAIPKARGRVVAFPTGVQYPILFLPKKGCKAESSPETPTKAGSTLLEIDLPNNLTSPLEGGMR